MYSTTTTGSTATPSATLPGKTSHPVKLLASETSSDSDISLIHTSPPYFTASSSLQSHLSLQTLPSVPSLQSLSHLDTFRLSLSSPALSLTSSSLQPITALGFSVINSGLLYAASGHNITVYDPTTSIHLETFNSNCAFSGSVKSISFCNGKIFTAHQDGKIRAWKINAAKRHHRLMATLPTVSDRLRHFPLPGNYVQVRRHKKSLWIEHNDAVSGLAVNDSLGLVYSVSWDKTLKIWRASDMKCLESVTAHDDAVNAVTVSVDGVVYTGSADMRIRVWVRPAREKRHALVATLEKHKSAVNALALSLDGSVLFSGSCDRSILVWERDYGANYMAITGALRGHDQAILCLMNVSDFLFSGSADQTVRIWRRGDDGKFLCLNVLVGHQKPVKSLSAGYEAESSDVVSLFSGSLDGKVGVWRIKLSNGSRGDSAPSCSSPDE